MLNPDKLSLAWMAWEADSANGYAHIAEKFHYHMQNDARVGFVNAYSGLWDALICIATPARWSLGGVNGALVNRPDLVFHTMFEVTPLPPGWVEVLNHAGLIWVPSNWTYDTFRKQGVTTPMFISGYGVNHAEYTEVDRQDHVERGRPMRFVLWADTLVSRKNVLKTIKCFIRAGLPNAELEVKLHSFAGMNAGTLFSDSKDRPLANITLHTGVWPRNRLVSWLHQADCGIYLSGGEGFGLQPLEMMATGLPMIVAGNTGMLEYLKADNHLPVPCPKQVKDPTYSLGYGYDAMAWEPDYDAAVEQIRWAYENREQLHTIGAAGAEESRQWRWEQQTDMAVQQLLQHFGR